MTLADAMFSHGVKTNSTYPMKKDAFSYVFIGHKKYIVWIYFEAINSRIRFRASIRLIISTQIVTESSLFGEARPAY